MMWAFQKKEKKELFFCIKIFGGVSSHGEMYKRLISIIDFLKG